MYGEVERVEQLTPQLVRVHLGGPGLAEFSGVAYADSYLNLQFPPPGAPYAVPFDPAAVRGLPREQQPAGRRYTVRAWDAERRQLSIDFVVHGDTGLAGRWASSARPGDLLQFVGPGGGYSPDANADWHLLVGDESALPAIAAAAEQTAPGRPVLVVAEVEGPDGELPLDSPGDLRVTWVHRLGGHDDGLLLRAVQGLDLPTGRGQAFVHGEAVATRALRRHLLTERIFAPADLSVSPYWRRDHTDEQWRRIKADWLREVELDVPVPV